MSNTNEPSDYGLSKEPENKPDANSSQPGYRIPEQSAPANPYSNPYAPTAHPAPQTGQSGYSIPEGHNPNQGGYNAAVGTMNQGSPSQAQTLAYWSLGLFGAGVLLSILTTFTGFTIFLSPLTAIAGIVLGVMSNKQEPSTLAKTGIWLNAIGLALFILLLIFIIGMVALFVGAASSGM